jgi:hypothetical protein
VLGRVFHGLAGSCKCPELTRCWSGNWGRAAGRRTVGLDRRLTGADRPSAARRWSDAPDPKATCRTYEATLTWPR